MGVVTHTNIVILNISHSLFLYLLFYFEWVYWLLSIFSYIHFLKKIFFKFLKFIIIF